MLPLIRQSKERDSVVSLLTAPLNIYKGFTSLAADWGCQPPRLPDREDRDFLRELIEDGDLCRGSWNASQDPGLFLLVVSIALLWVINYYECISALCSWLSLWEEHSQGFLDVPTLFLSRPFSTIDPEAETIFWSYFSHTEVGTVHTPSNLVLSKDKIFQISWKTNGLSSFRIISSMEKKKKNVNIIIK